MRVEIDALLLDLAEPSQGEHLKSAGIRKNRTIPRHKLVQSSHFLDQLVSGAQMQMVGVGQLHLSADLPEIIRRNRTLDGSNRTHIHKYRRLDISVHRMENASLRASFLF